MMMMAMMTTTMAMIMMMKIEPRNKPVSVDVLKDDRQRLGTAVKLLAAHLSGIGLAWEKVLRFKRAQEINL